MLTLNIFRYLPLYTKLRITNDVWHVKYELWIHEGLKMREKILSGSKFQLKTWVLLNIRKDFEVKRNGPG